MEPSEMSSDQIERLRRYYTTEEEFLDEYSQVASVAAHLLEDAWRPQYNCNDATRQQRQYFISSGELSSLVFDGAAVYQTERGFSSAQIVLRTAKRR
jgi:hypothetical protein